MASKIPYVDTIADTEQFCQLHFYLVTSDQEAALGKNYEASYNSYTNLTDVYF
jgi:hypothetical protein